MTGRFRTWLLRMCVAWLLVAPPAVAQSTPLEPAISELVLGFSPAENAEALQSTADEFASLLSYKLGVAVRAVVALDYMALLEGMRSERVHVGWVTPYPYVLARQLFDAKVLLTQTRGGRATYHSAIVVREDSGITQLDQLRARSIAWVDPTSTSGYVVPRFLLRERGLSPDTLFSRQVYAGGHDSAVFAVARGNVDAAAVWADPPAEKTGAWTRFAKGQNLRPLAYSEGLPSDGVIVHPKFAAERPRFVRLLSSSLIALGEQDAGRRVLKKLNNSDGFVPAKPEQYELMSKAFTELRSGTIVPESAGHLRRVSAVVALALAIVLCVSGRASRWRNARRALGSSALVAMFCLSWGDARISLTDLWHGHSNALPFLRGLFPPAFVVLPHVLAEIVTTLELAFLGTVLALPFAVLLGLLGASNVLPSMPARAFFRAITGISRSIDPMILALVMVSAVGLGAVPGIVALAFHSVGALAKLFYEACEAADVGPADALRSVGASRSQIVRWAIWPQIAPHIVSIVLFRFELNVRLSTVLGLVGAGGIGFLLTTYLRGAQYEKVTVVVGAIVLLIMTLDALSSRLRHRVA